ncbi:ABC1 kinase family protein [Chamaesiphon minutus]|uniref:Putative unusual protein kinase n=1 Tax=Chamaesiphon minutus (strain ATCC 27169 / PCC 6605) TaxID=1173020 RepID=K9UJF2_CHAP6|nr:AarF/ABC1/UbiB kinase family protein [Chamaesiphon minutus]AFY94591.1 putative unusual protein kinase [Chamaesiphon minutus PCC 6605]
MNTTPSNQFSPEMNRVDAPSSQSVAAVSTELVADAEVVNSRRVKEITDDTWLGYDPIAIAQYYSSQPLKVFGRFISIFIPIVNFALGLWLDKITNKSKANLGKRAIQIRGLLTKLGPAYIKIGQALSTRPDLVPPQFLEELAQLQDNIPAFSNEIAYQFIEEELGDRPEAIYAEISDLPIAAASLGQVYKGKLWSGEEVAIKVQRPGLADSIALDLHVVRTLAIWAQTNFKQIRSNLVSIVDEFAERIFEEMDYENEGRNAERFAELYGSMQDIYVPSIYWQYTGRRVLTMEWITGTKLTNLEAVAAQGLDATYLVEVGVQCSLRQLLEHGFFHADPHPGNLLATPDGKLAYLDFGMMSQVKPYQRYGLVEAIVHLVNRDFDGLGRDFVKLEFLTPDTDLTPIIPALSYVFNSSLGATSTNIADLDFKSVTDQLSGVMYEFPFQVPAYYALILRSLATLEGIAISVDPNFKVLAKAYPYVAKRLLTDTAPDLRNSLKELLFKDGSFRWNRLENLLNNARSSDEYDLNQVIDQTLDFILSDRGTFIREYLADEIVRGLDNFGSNTLQSVTHAIQKGIGIKVPTPPVTAQPQSNGLEHIQRIWGILQQTKGFDPTMVLPKIPQILMKSETQSFGQKIASGLTQRMAARLIREVLLQDVPSGIAVNDSLSERRAPQPQLALPTRVRR